MIGTYTFKYRGVLKNFDINNINRHTFPTLIKANLFDVKELSATYRGGDYFGVELDGSNEYINDFYLYNHEEYHLKLEVLEDMFDNCELRCEPIDKLERKIRNLEFNLETHVSNYSKIKYLKEVIFSVKNQILNKDYYLLYTKNLEIGCYDSWFEFFRSEQIDGEDFTYIFKYLKGEYDFVPPFIENLWTNCFYAKGLVDFCTKRILHLERLSGINEADVLVDKYLKSKINYLLTDEVEEEKQYHDIRLDIFKDKKSREAFDYILNKWKKPKDTAFYSKIFKYLQSKGYIVIEGDDSEKYREFIIDNFNLTSYKRIQKRTSFKNDDVWAKSFSDFESYLEEFTQKNE